MTTRSRPLFAARKRAGLLAAFALVIGSVAFGATPASASQGSIPAEVAAYAADPNGLLARLDTFVGVGGDGKGLDFGAGAAVGQLNRVFGFTTAWLAGEKTDLPVERRNEWTAPITIDKKPVGLAIIWINPSTVEPELADFLRGAGIGAALADVPADAALVHDEPRAAWFAFVAPDLTPLVAGSSGLDGTTTLDVYRGLIADRTVPQVDAGPNFGSMLPLLTIGIVVLLIVAVLMIPLIRGRTRKDAPAPALETVAPVEPAATEVPVEVPVKKPAAGSTKPAAKAPSTAKPTSAAKSAAKPASVAKTTAAPKPASPKPASVSKPAASAKAATAKTAAPKTVAPKRPTAPRATGASVAKPAAGAARKPAASRTPKPPAQPQ